jgi:hypothetical protein
MAVMVGFFAAGKGLRGSASNPGNPLFRERDEKELEAEIQTMHELSPKASSLKMVLSRNTQIHL